MVIKRYVQLGGLTSKATLSSWSYASFALLNIVSWIRLQRPRQEGPSFEYLTNTETAVMMLSTLLVND